MMRKKELELLLEKLKPIETPKFKLEQYTTPSYLAAELLNLAFLNGDIKRKTVADFGCGSGRLAIGAALLGAKKVIGIDIDASAIQQAKENLELVKQLKRKRLNIEFICSDIRDINIQCDTVVQNPPFGIRSKTSDIIFLQKALLCAKKIYSIHRNGRKETRKF
ncbi:MAG: 50S ribosomal protein L11 methyltransferase, partial [Candidatus Aenigmarchaeota archaeon]|nr:50S ribosomal protein L11 methyltransferase [Candidatus Aenigmarchaeota archaeon]